MQLIFFKLSIHSQLTIVKFLTKNFSIQKFITIVFIDYQSFSKPKSFIS